MFIIKINDLPDEIIEEIIKQLNYIKIIKFSITSKINYELIIRYYNNINYDYNISKNKKINYLANIAIKYLNNHKKIYIYNNNNNIKLFEFKSLNIIKINNFILNLNLIFENNNYFNNTKKNKIKIYNNIKIKPEKYGSYFNKENNLIKYTFININIDIRDILKKKISRLLIIMLIILQYILLLIINNYFYSTISNLFLLSSLSESSSSSENSSKSSSFE